MASHIERRKFLATLLGGAAVAWPLAARAQQATKPLIGYLDATSAAAAARFITAFREGLKSGGYVEGENIAIEYRWAEGEFTRLPALAHDLLARRVAILVTATLPATLAAKGAAKGGTPIVFALSADPVEFGVVSSIRRPDGNITGITQVLGTLGGKRVEILHELIPSARTIAILSNPTNPHGGPHTASAKEAASKLGLRSEILEAATQAEVETAMTNLSQRPIDAVLVSDDPLFRIAKARLVGQAEKERVPAIHFGREFTEAGGLVSYGPHFPTLYSKVGQYTARLLKGAQTSDLPIEQPDRFELVINLKTAKALGLQVPDSLLARADEVIE
jgi:putative tryptophan/tyrosine transport system substrate-binding protein